MPTTTRWQVSFPHVGGTTVSIATRCRILPPANVETWKSHGRRGNIFMWLPKSLAVKSVLKLIAHHNNRSIPLQLSAHLRTLHADHGYCSRHTNIRGRPHRAFTSSSLLYIHAGTTSTDWRSSWNSRARPQISISASLRVEDCMITWTSRWRYTKSTSAKLVPCERWVVHESVKEKRQDISPAKEDARLDTERRRTGS